MHNLKNSTEKVSLPRTVFSIKWLGALMMALAVASVFVMLSGWQWERSNHVDPEQENSAARRLNTSVALAEAVSPGQQLPTIKIDQMVTVYGTYEDSQAIVEQRLQDGQEGYWVVTALRTPEGFLIPAARAWVRNFTEIPSIPRGEQKLTGRLIPSEAPQPHKNNNHNSFLHGGEIPIVKTLSTAELGNLWFSFDDTETVYAAAIASETISTGEHNISGQDIKAISLIPQQETPFNWLNVFYAVEWIIFAGFSIFLWWRLAYDDYRRKCEKLAARENLILQ